MFVEYYKGANIMLEDFLSYIVEELSVNNADKLLLAVSGGVDSMVMLDLFHKSEFTFEVAHVNHSSRNGQSDKDAEFVKKECLRLDIPCHIKVLDYTSLSKGNFQSNARDARYLFFESIILEKQIDLLATAHHMDDRWETFFMNLNRKSGIAGLTSLKPRVQNIIRPLMSFEKTEILCYAHEHNIAFVEDASNDTDYYTRNKVRHHLTKAANDIFPDFVKNVNQSINNLEKSNNLIDSLILAGSFMDQSNDRQVVDIEKVKSVGSTTELLYHILSSKGFTYSDTMDILSTESTGAMFYSTTHEALYDRGRLIIRTKREQTDNLIKLHKDGEYELQDGRLVLFKNANETNTGEILEFSYPIQETDLVILRSLKPGDKYKPSHMNGKTKTFKKLLSDLKVDRFTKEEILVLEINGEIKKIIGLNK
ncbi:MAG: tRNA(Ile)-lysidine synthase [Saprospiraceae bacterium]|jgi:tRNA(Ile)-lysidine synthase